LRLDRKAAAATPPPVLSELSLGFPHPVLSLQKTAPPFFPKTVLSGDTTFFLHEPPNLFSPLKPEGEVSATAEKVHLLLRFVFLGRPPVSLVFLLGGLPPSDRDSLDPPQACHFYEGQSISRSFSGPADGLHEQNDPLPPEKISPPFRPP